MRDQVCCRRTSNPLTYRLISEEPARLPWHRSQPLLGHVLATGGILALLLAASVAQAAPTIGARASQSIDSAPAYPLPDSPPPGILDRDGDNVLDTRDNCDEAPNGDQSDLDHDGLGDACDASDASVGPRLGKTVVVKVVSGRVYVRRPPAGAAIGPSSSGALGTLAPLHGAEVVPVRAMLHVTAGRVAIISAASRLRGATQTVRAEFYGGVFQVRQGPAARPTTDIALSSPSFRKLCGPASRKNPSRRVVSRVWGTGRGMFRTIGRQSSATAQSTTWLTEERCDGTRTRVTRGRVGLQVTKTGRKVTVIAGRSYLAPARVAPPA